MRIKPQRGRENAEDATALSRGRSQRLYQRVVDSLRLRKAFSFSLWDFLRNLMFTWLCCFCKGMMSKRDRAYVQARKKLEKSLDAIHLVRTLT